MLQRIYYTKQSCTLIYYNTNTAVANYNHILFYGVKLSKEFCVHHIEQDPVLLTAEEIYSFMISHQIHQLLHMQNCSLYFNGSVLGMYPIEELFYQNDIDTTNLKNLSHAD